MITNKIFPFLLLTFLLGCNNSNQLPVYGNKIAVGNDSVDYTIPSFSFFNQDSLLVNDAVIENKILVAEFFFTSCPSICPKMQAQMLRVYEKYLHNPDILLLAYSIDPERDSVVKLNSYAQKLGIGKSDKWHFLTGDKDSIFALAENFLVSAAEDPDAPGGHVHSGNFILIDKHKRIRGYYDGTDEASVEKLLNGIDVLLRSKH